LTTSQASPGAEGARPRVGLVGGGDVVHRHYLPALEQLAESVELVACCDPRPDARERVVSRAAQRWPQIRAHETLAQMLAGEKLDAVFNLTPAPVHAEVSEACLRAGLHVYSEKPIASTIADADRLILLAAEHDRLLLCAPGEAVAPRNRWLAELIAGGRLGPVTLAVAHHADTGPATWREYTGDPTVFYGPGVGPLVDHGIYRLHALTFLLGPVRRVQAMGAISASQRRVRGGPLTGRTIEVTTPDHVLVNLEFAGGALGQLLASFGTPATKAPWLELHCTNGTISMGGYSWDLNPPVNVYLDDDSQAGVEGWTSDLQPPPATMGVVEGGAAHFVGCLRGEETPALTAEHARHVLDIIIRTYDSIADGQSHATQTTF
jgi:predicted dehydrogenase